MSLKAPAFWLRSPGVLSTLLSPAAWIVGQVAAARRRHPGVAVPVPVLCCGNLTMGGTGKTTVVLSLTRLLQQRGIVVHLLTRGYGRSAEQRKEPLRVDPAIHTVTDAGDEALLLAEVAPCWACADRVSSARAAIRAGAEFLIMDDGFQNPGLRKDLSLLLIDGATGLGNGCVFPAGPLREKPADGFAAAGAVVITGRDEAGIASQIPAHLPVLHAALEMDKDVRTLRGQRWLAFSGLARPEKFFTALREAGVEPVRCAAFPDHHVFTDSELNRLRQSAADLNAGLLTTPKDAVRLPAGLRQTVRVVGVSTVWPDEAALDTLLEPLLTRRKSAV